ncbi:Gfo/Idh/MocA family protein [Agromyces silvae]|uniref:Gfo/Idh/MocA family protein n=1 Tax=Agromyces silvae TaxID=3388266 RepID=UPI00280B1990|nr:Gfo/Idh/MocA family oxidoreductase [Agromyces protaetiae]
MLVGAAHWHAPLYMDALRTRFDLVEVAEERGSAGADSGIDVAFVMTAHERMAAQAAHFIERGIPVVLEKPGALNLADLRSLRDLAHRHGVPVAVPLVHRAAPFMSVLRSIARPTYLTVTYLVGPPQRYVDAECAWMLDPDSGGGVLVNLGAHFADVATELFGAPIASVRAVGHHALHHLDIEDHAVMILTTEDGRSATVELGYVFPSAAAKRHVSMTLAGEDGFVSIGAGGDVSLTRADGTIERARIDVDSDLLFRDFVAEVAESFDAGFAALPQIDDLVAAMEVVDLAYRDMHGDRDRGRAWAS